MLPSFAPSTNVIIQWLGGSCKIFVFQRLVVPNRVGVFDYDRDGRQRYGSN
jgi:hypothetical protein